MIRCRKCHRQLKDPASQLRGMGKYCAGESSTPHVRHHAPGESHDTMPLFPDHIILLTPAKCSTPHTVKSTAPIVQGDIVDFDLLRVGGWLTF